MDQMTSADTLDSRCGRHCEGNFERDEDSPTARATTYAPKRELTTIAIAPSMWAMNTQIYQKHGYYVVTSAGQDLRPPPPP